MHRIIVLYKVCTPGENEVNVKYRNPKDQFIKTHIKCIFAKAEISLS